MDTLFQNLNGDDCSDGEESSLGAFHLLLAVIMACHLIEDIERRREKCWQL
jgi:hypothetical protein